MLNFKEIELIKSFGHRTPPPPFGLSSLQSIVSVFVFDLHVFFPPENLGGCKHYYVDSVIVDPRDNYTVLLRQLHILTTYNSLTSQKNKSKSKSKRKKINVHYYVKRLEVSELGLRFSFLSYCVSKK